MQNKYLQKNVQLFLWPHGQDRGQWHHGCECAVVTGAPAPPAPDYTTFTGLFIKHACEILGAARGSSAGPSCRLSAEGSPAAPAARDAITPRVVAYEAPASSRSAIIIVHTGSSFLDVVDR